MRPPIASTMSRIWPWTLATFTLALIGNAACADEELSPPKVLVVNMMPKNNSSETSQDSESNLAVNPSNPLQIAGTAFTPNPLGGSKAPIYVSRDGGNTWALNAIVPSVAGSQTGTSDITLRFGAKSNVLYAGTLNAGNIHLNILRTSNFLSPVTMTLLVDRPSVDQPYVAADSDAGKDQVFIGDNDFGSPGGKTATIDQSLDAATAPPPAGFSVGRVEERVTGGQDGPQIRIAMHPSGVLYGIFVSWHSFNGSIATADYVVVRDDHRGAGPNRFKDLMDADGKAGKRVVTNVKIPWAMPGLGQERTGGDPAIAVDPTNPKVVYIAYADRIGVNDYTLHVRRSKDSGVTWSQDLITITNAKNPGLAINSTGEVGFLHEQLVGTGASQRWVNLLTRTNDEFKHTTDLVLATVPANIPPRTFFPYRGDYVHVMAVGKDYYGVFCTSNIPDKANFPNDVKFQRNANFTTKTLLGTDGTTKVDISIDPYFFKVTP